MLNTIKELLLRFVEFIGLSFWIEITTDKPTCTYYFGPFLTKKEAQATQSGYIEDLKNEGAQDINANIKRCKPQNLTIFNELDELRVTNHTTSITNLRYEM